MVQNYKIQKFIRINNDNHDEHLAQVTAASSCPSVRRKSRKTLERQTIFSCDS